MSERNNYEERKQKVYQLICADFYKPMKIKELAILMEVASEDRPVLEQILMELLSEGKIALSKRGKYSRAQETIAEGVFTAHPKGFGFVTVGDMPEDIFIPAEKTNGAMHQDRVRVCISPIDTGRRREGKILEITERGMKSVVCTYQQCRNYGFAVPDNKRFAKDIFIPQSLANKALDGQKILVEITDYGADRQNPEGKVTEVLGYPDDSGVDVLSVIRDMDIPAEFPERVLNQAARAAKAVSEADRAGRKDLRSLITFTIDGDDSKDFDDAVSLTMEGENYLLGVHIADVTNYVQENSALDREALARGTSVYLADRVIPMLPFELSNGICSLNEGEDRLTLSCIMTIDPTGEIVGHEIAETVICSAKRMTYRQVNSVLNDPQSEYLKEYEAYLPILRQMAELSGKLRERRNRRGAIDFNFPEAKIAVDAAGHVVDIYPYERNTATKLIEDFMLAANETVAEDYYWQELPFVYRNHDKPDPEKIRHLSAFLTNYGYHMKASRDEIHPKEIQKLLGMLEGSAEEPLLARLVLHSMKQAKYEPICRGHFGQAASYYCHFTSPIRRYPDLQIHRIIKDLLRGRMDEERRAHYDAILTEVSSHSSKMERRAEEAERETAKKKKAEYMEKHIGEIYEAVVSGVTEWGMFVELPNTVEGLIRVTELLDDFYVYDPEAYELRGNTRGKVYRLGQKLMVRCIGCSRSEGTVDFEPA